MVMIKNTKNNGTLKSTCLVNNPVKLKEHRCPFVLLKKESCTWMAAWSLL